MLRFLKEYFSLSNNEQRGIIGLVLVILLVFGGTRIYFMMKEPTSMPQDNTALLAMLEDKASSENTSWKDLPEAEDGLDFFPFDPNTVSKEDLINLGFSSSVASTLINYRSKGGKFYQKEDLKKVYGVSESLYLKLEDYIVIPQKTNTSPLAPVAPSNKQEGQTQESTAKKKVFVNINTADSALLTTIKGIGPAFSARIVKYRNLLGGFRTKEQLLEVYGITPEVYEGIEEQVFVDGDIHPIKVNDASWSTLKNHPYISSELANILLNYKKAHGQIDNFNFLLESQLISQENFDKITPYLSLEK